MMVRFFHPHGVMLEDPVFPARSVAWTRVGFNPSVRAKSQVKVEFETEAGVPLQVTLTTPDRASVMVPVALIAEVLRITPPVGEVISTFGGVLSRLTVALAVAVLPARSVAVPLLT